jgi:hypothetical protein
LAAFRKGREITGEKKDSKKVIGYPRKRKKKKNNLQTKVKALALALAWAIDSTSCFLIFL